MKKQKRNRNPKRETMASLRLKLRETNQECNELMNANVAWRDFIREVVPRLFKWGVPADALRQLFHRQGLHGVAPTAMQQKARPWTQGPVLQAARTAVRSGGRAMTDPEKADVVIPDGWRRVKRGSIHAGDMHLNSDLMLWFCVPSAWVGSFWAALSSANVLIRRVG